MNLNVKFMSYSCQNKLNSEPRMRVKNLSWKTKGVEYFPD